jgi:hypothetical protein
VLSLQTVVVTVGSIQKQLVQDKMLVHLVVLVAVAPT